MSPEWRAGPRVVAELCECTDRGSLDGPDRRLVLELGEFAGEGLTVARAQMVSQPEQVVACGVGELDVDHTL